MIFLESFFEITVVRSPDAIAVETDKSKISYQTLNKYSNQIAQYLVACGVRPNDRICIFTKKDVSAYAAVLGILKSGACWVPLSLGQPEERLRNLVQKIEPKLIITDGSTLTEARAIRDADTVSLPILALNSDNSVAGQNIASESDISVYSSNKPEIEGRSMDDLAYIIFTSGSTGTPKGVMVLHRNIVQFIEICHDIFNIEEGCRFAHHSDLSFDPSLFDLFYGWSRTGTIIPFNKPSYRINPTLFLRELKVNVWFSVPSAITTIVESGGLKDPEVASVRHLILGGELLTGKLASAWYEAFPQSEIYNVYGTTETAIISHCYNVPKDIDPEKPVPVGTPLKGFRVRLMDGNTLVPPGGVGECVCYGSQISPGYWANEEETRAQFVPDPLDSRMPQTWYRTGDLLRLRPDGLYEFVDRADTQIKLRGHRVELGEIEIALESHPSVAEAAVIPLSHEDRPDGARLIAFIAGHVGATEDDLQEYLEDKLPRYMVPIDYVIEAIPLPRNRNGKVDRLALTKRAKEKVRL